MTMAFYEHPFSSYVQKAYEKGILFESKMIDGSERSPASSLRSGRSSASR